MSEPTDADLAARFHPLFARIGEHAVDRERERRLAHEELAWLRAEGFGALRVPVEHGGAGVSLTQQFTLLIDLAEAESNLPRALRTHFDFVEELGALILVGLPEPLRIPSPDVRILGYGVLLLLIIRFRPRGLWVRRAA